MASPTYDISIHFIRAENLPIGDLASLSSDPYVFATLHTLLSDSDSDHNPPLRFRTPTERKKTAPQWDQRWDVSNVPKDGTGLRVELFDEDCRGHDDRLGGMTIEFGKLEEWARGAETWYTLKKGASKKVAVATLWGATKSPARVLIRIEVTGETHLPEGSVKRAFTAGPNSWSKHYSPIIGKMIHSKDSENDPQKATVFSFEANKLQLTGPPPCQLCHTYVGFAPFVTAYFTRSGMRGRLLNHALHSQYNSIYAHDTRTEYGTINDPPPSLAERFLQMAHWEDGHRIFTYVITLDSEWRFTETGDEFGIDLLSKHGLHSDVSRVIAFSGEFFIRRKKIPFEIAPHHGHDHHHDPAHYELVIDNGSGTYRPSKEGLPLLKKFLCDNLRGIGDVIVYDCMDKTLMDEKERRKEARNKDGGKVFRQRSRGSMESSISRGDEEELETGRERNVLKRLKMKFMFSGDPAGTGGAAVRVARAATR